MDSAALLCVWDKTAGRSENGKSVYDWVPAAQDESQHAGLIPAASTKNRRYLTGFLGD